MREDPISQTIFFLCEKLGKTPDEIGAMPFPHLIQLNEFFVIVAEEKEKALKKAQKSSHSNSPPPRAKPHRRGFKGAKRR